MLYKLKIDLPTFKAGDLFYLDQDGSLRHKETDIIAYHYGTLAKFPDALERFWEPVEEEFKRWRAELKKAYYYLDDEADVRPSSEDHYPGDDNHHRCGNYFQTKEEAQACADYLKALTVVRDDAKGFVPDWEDRKQGKWFVIYDHEQGKLCQYQGSCEEVNGVFCLPYFETEGDARASIDKHKAEWLTIFGVKGESDDYEE